MKCFLKNKLFISASILVLLGFLTAFLITAKNHTQTLTRATPTPPTPTPFHTNSGKRPQFVLLSFDGSLSLDMWKQTTEFAQKMQKEGVQIHFTYFISGVYFLAPQYASLYHPPLAAPGTSAIHFSDSRDSISTRIQAINTAYQNGHEIASHANGHFRGFPWSENNWSQEFSEFNKLIFNWEENNQIKDNSIKLKFSPKEVVGFRAPLLSRNNNLFVVENKNGFLYDSSEISTSSAAWPSVDKNGLWHIPLSEIPLAGTHNKIIAMDYNFYSFQTGARDTLKKGTLGWQKAYDQVFNSYMSYFESNYKGDRAPVLIGHHFSLWNDGLYWDVLQNVAQKICGQPEVYCVSFKELVSYLNHASL